MTSLGNLLILNGGSSSLKFAVFAGAPGAPLLARGAVSPLSQKPVLKFAARGKAEVETPLGQDAIGMEQALMGMADALGRTGHAAAIRFIGHRIVHGGRDFAAATLLDETVVAALHRLAPFAPLHQPVNLEIIDKAAALFPSAMQYGCFDTAFHATRPRLAKLYGLPRDLAEAGIVSHGFHGLSFGYIAGQLRQRDGAGKDSRAIIAHLGSGSSLCALKNGGSVATTMGFSPLDGLLMSTRCGAIDPGVILYLLEHRRMSAAEITDLLYRRSGLAGVSGISGDMRVLLSSDAAAAREAVDLFVYRASREIGSLAAALGGLDRLVFTGGIGENSPQIRERIAASSAWLGARIDLDANNAGEICISTPESAVELLVIPTDEERAIAEQILAVLN